MTVTRLAGLLGTLAALARPVAAAPAALPPVSPEGRLELQFWAGWTDFEGQAMMDVVDDFNRSQDRLFVRYVPVGTPDEKMLIATAGGDPPDLSGLYDYNLVSFADKNAFLPLDEFLSTAGIWPERFLPVYWDNCQYHGHTWAVPTTPATVALHWNKAMFRKAGLDPEKPPRTIAELDALAEQLTVRDKDGHITQMGFLPWEPGWWNWSWPYFFGGRLWDGRDRITCDEPACVAAFTWVQGYAKKYGVKFVQVFQSGFGDFSSPQNAFMAGKVAMEIQGVWMYNFITQYAPKMDWGAAPPPNTDPNLYGRSIADLDILTIPRGARHPEASFAFIKYLMEQGPMEKLCLGQRKFTPLKAVTPGFVVAHPNRFIDLFIRMAGHPQTFSLPQLPFFQEYMDELNVGMQKVYLLQATPEAVLGEIQRKMQKALDRELRRQRRLGLVPA